MLVSGRSPVVGAILCMLALPVLIGRTNGLEVRVTGYGFWENLDQFTFKVIPEMPLTTRTHQHPKI